MALALFSRRSTRERHLQVQNSELREQLHQRLTSPVVQDHNVFVGFGDAANAQTTLNFLKGASATAVRVIRQRVQGLERGVFARRFINGQVEDTQLFDHPLARLIADPTVNEEGLSSHTAYQLFGLITTQYEALADSYLFIIRDGMGVPRSLQMARPGTIRPLLSGGVVAGYEQVVSGSRLALKPTDLIRIWEPDPFDLFQSRSIMGKNRVTIETAQFAEERWRNFYQNDATPLMAFETADKTVALPDEEKQEEVSRKFMERFWRRGGKHTGTPSFTKPGWTIKQLNSEDGAASGVLMMEHLNGREYNAFGVSPSLVGKNQDMNRAAAETARFTFDQNTVEPITKAIDDAFTLQLAIQYPTAEGVRLIVKTLPFVSRDKAFDLQRDQIDLQTKVRTVNQVRSDRVPALDPVPYGGDPVGTFADTPYTGEIEELDLSSLSTVPAEPAVVVVETESGDGEGGGDEDEGRSSTGRSETRLGGSMSETQTRVHSLNQMRAHFTPEEEWKRTIQRDEVFTPRFRSVQRAVFLQQGKDTLARFLAAGRVMLVSWQYLKPDAALSDRIRWAEPDWHRAAADDLVEQIFPTDIWDEMFEKTTEVVRKQSFVASATEATEAITGKVFKLTDVAQRALTEMDLTHIKFVNAQTQSLLRGQLRLGLANGESTDQIAKRITDVFGQRRKDSIRIARTEIASAVQVAQVEGYRQTGVVGKKQWNTSLDGDVRDSHIIEGQTRDLDDDFTLSNGARASSPAAVDLSAEDRINCRCFVTPIFEGEEALGVL